MQFSIIQVEIMYTVSLPSSLFLQYFTLKKHCFLPIRLSPLFTPAQAPLMISISPLQLNTVFDLLVIFSFVSCTFHLESRWKSKITFSNLENIFFPVFITRCLYHLDSNKIMEHNQVFLPTNISIQAFS